MRGIKRRSLLALGAATAGMGRAPDPPMVPPGDSLGFRLIRSGAQIGTHALSFEHVPNGLEVQVAVDVLVKWGLISLVRYNHSIKESWRGGRLQSLTSQTNKNGSILEMRAWRNETGALRVEGTGTPAYVAPDNALPTTYWNRHMLEGPMIGTQDGSLGHPTVREAGINRVGLASGDRLPARGYTVNGDDLNFEVFYDLQWIWAGLSFIVSDGSIVHYERM